MGWEWEPCLVMLPLLLEGRQYVLHGEHEKGSTFRFALFAAALEWYGSLRRTAPYLRSYVVVSEFACQIEFEKWVHRGVGNGLQDRSLVDCVKGFL